MSRDFLASARNPRLAVSSAHDWHKKGSGELHEKALVTRVKLRSASLLESTQRRSQEKRGLKFKLLSVQNKLQRQCSGSKIKVQNLPSGYPSQKLAKNDDFTVVVLQRTARKCSKF